MQVICTIKPGRREATGYLYQGFPAAFASLASLVRLILYPEEQLNLNTQNNNNEQF